MEGVIRLVFRITAIALMLAAVSIPAAATPCVPCSTIPDCIFACPAGDMYFEVVVSEGGPYPTMGLPVALDFFGCPTFAACLLPTGDYSVNPVAKQITGVTDLSGILVLPIAMGGTCPDAKVIVSSGYVELARRSLASPDRNGDQFVGDDDVAAVQALVGTSDPTADFDCDGAVTSADVGVEREHLGHHCAGVTATAPRRWGELKLRYR